MVGSATPASPWRAAVERVLIAAFLLGAFGLIGHLIFGLRGAVGGVVLAAGADGALDRFLRSSGRSVRVRPGRRQHLMFALAIGMAAVTCTAIAESVAGFMGAVVLTLVALHDALRADTP